MNADEINEVVKFWLYIAGRRSREIYSLVKENVLLRARAEKNVYALTARNECMRNATRVNALLHKRKYSGKRTVCGGCPPARSRNSIHNKRIT